MKMIWFALLLSFACCKDKITVENVSIEDSSFYTPDPPSPITLKNKTHAQLLGVWTEGSTENATFSIHADSIFYVEDHLNVPYYISGDSIKINFPTYTYNALISFTKDTLILVDSYGDSKYWRFRNE